MDSNPVPVLTSAEYEALVKSIETYGVITPVIVSGGPACEGMLVDGFHRTEIAKNLGIECPKHFKSFETEAEFRIAQIELNLQRRQLTVGKKILLGMRLEPWERDLSQKRMLTGASSEGTTRDRVGAKLGMSGTTYERGKKILERSDELTVQAFLMGEISVREGMQRLRKIEKLEGIAKIETAIAPPTGKYGTIVVDPPWDNGSALYPTQTLEEIAALPVPALAEETCVLWLWVVNSMLPEGIELLRRWEFEYKGIYTWDKDRVGTGYWMHNQTEHALLGVKGSPRLGSFQRKSLLRIKRREHSRKPDEFYEYAEKYHPGVARIDLYGREKRPGWEVWGAETDKFTTPACAPADACDTLRG